MENKIRKIEKKKVVDRTETEHMILIKSRFNGSVRDYLLSMGEFKEDGK